MASTSKKHVEPVLTEQSEPAVSVVAHDTPSPQTESLDIGNLEKIRSILYGPQTQEYEKRFARLEERLLKELSELREEFRRRHDGLELYMKQELESLNARLNVEHDERSEALRKASRDLTELTETFEQKLARLTEHHATGNRELRQLMLEQSKHLEDDLQRKYAEISALLERQMHEVRHDKTDRSALAGLFTEMAMRLNHEWPLPDADAANYSQA